jgi:hypothetical protein
MQETSVSVKKTSTLLCVFSSWYSASRKMPRPRPPRPPHLHSLPTSIAPSPAQKAWWVLQRPAAAPAAEEERHALSPQAGGRPLPQSPPTLPQPPPPLPRLGDGLGCVSSAAAPATCCRVLGASRTASANPARERRDQGRRRRRGQSLHRDSLPPSSMRSWTCRYMHGPQAGTGSAPARAENRSRKHTRHRGAAAARRAAHRLLARIVHHVMIIML